MKDRRRAEALTTYGGTVWYGGRLDLRRIGAEGLGGGERLDGRIGEEGFCQRESGRRRDVVVGRGMWGRQGEGGEEGRKIEIEWGEERMRRRL